jgi:hypothetical protein
MAAPRNQYGSILVVEDRALDALTDLLEANGYNVRGPRTARRGWYEQKGRPLARFSLDLCSGWLGIYAPAAVGTGDR